MSTYPFIHIPRGSTAEETSAIADEFSTGKRDGMATPADEILSTVSSLLVDLVDTSLSSNRGPLPRFKRLRVAYVNGMMSALIDRQLNQVAGE